MTPEPPRLRAVVLPHPPLIAPELSGPGAEAAEPVRSACLDAVRDLLAAGWPSLVVVGGGSRTTLHGPGAWGTLAGYGVAVAAPAVVAAAAAGGAGAGGAGADLFASLPLSLTVGCLLLDRSAPQAASASLRGQRVELAEIDIGADAQACRRWGAHLASRRPLAGWLVLGDGTTKRTERAPGAFDPRAEAFDAGAESALAAGSPERILALDPEAAAELGAAGRSAWQVLAGAWEHLVGVPATAKIDYSGAPFGVGYLVARWSGPT